MSTTKTKEPRTQSTVWYLSLSIFEKYNMKPPKRKSFTAKIKSACKSLGKTREDFGIIAKARATMYFNDVWSSVSYDAIERLAKNGTDIIFIEKEAVAQALCKYADNYGIALVDTQGALTDYGRDLVEAAGVSGANVAVVTDYDASGIKIAHDAGDIPRLGVDQEMLDYFGLDKYSSKISVPMKAAKDVMTPIEDLVTHDVFEFLKYKKVEIDAVIAAVGSERFWEYLMVKLEEHYPTRDYARVIDPEPNTSLYYPDVISRFERSLGDYISLILEDEEETIRNELEEVEGFIDDVGERRRQIGERYQSIIDKDKTLKELGDKLTTDIKPILDKLDNLIIELRNKRSQKQKEKRDESQ